MGLFNSLIYQAGRLTGKAVSAARAQMQEVSEQKPQAAPEPQQPVLSPWEIRLQQARQFGTPSSEKFNIGMAYVNGTDGAPQDTEQAIYWFKEAASDGYGPGETALAQMFFEEMYDCPQEEGLRLMKKCADRDLAPMQNRLARVYEDMGDTRNYIRYLEIARQNDEGWAWHNLALEYALGGVLKQDQKKAHTYFLKAAEKGISNAQFCLYQQYRRALGVEQDLREATRWLRAAMDNDNVDALLEMAHIQEDGDELEEARKLYERAAKLDSEEAAAWLEAHA